jgi:16S rRNA (uracil1498-N3)-methyltransferase
MVERDDRAPVATFVSPGTFASGDRVALDDDAVQHARVRRLRSGSRVRLLNGRGATAWGELAEIGQRGALVDVERVVEATRPTPLEVIVPVADRDRMLLAAEKVVELQATAWRPVFFARSRSVSPRGEGEKFRARVRARMRAALEQSGGSWLPDIHVEVDWPDAAAAVPRAWTRLVMDAAGASLSSIAGASPTAIAVGPEGGLEDAERTEAERAGWRLASLGAGTLRFETAIIAAAAVIRALQYSARS